ncbi:hypothetical protein HXX76_016225 [Chlamydomonas incerta]|uniref:Uncharacterized protein n=1 Tax=Chlamydomonas incerta TaxID=51695 RepID=A0A835VQW6_CHLIN|nr:hypothetical protein HXX76_016225 [Chlamydomonas incerta]|eukprot:KAG2422186.1 hypothetical protein HXX76_016225 [Chlamydomonas incerta]
MSTGRSAAGRRQRGSVHVFRSAKTAALASCSAWRSKRRAGSGRAQQAPSRRRSELQLPAVEAKAQGGQAVEEVGTEAYRPHQAESFYVVGLTRLTAAEKRKPRGRAAGGSKDRTCPGGLRFSAAGTPGSPIT